MAYAISIKSEHQSSKCIRSLWHRWGALEQEPSMDALSYPPHITLAIYEELPSEKLFAGLDAAKRQLEKHTITFDSLGYFETPNSIIVWAAPTLPDQVLAAHKNIHKEIDANLCHEHYRPDNWVPHCTLATAVPLSKKSEALDLIDQPFNSIDVTFDTVDCVSFLPVQLLKEYTLTA